MSRARDIANLVDANGDIKAGALDNVAAFPTGWSATLDGSDMVFVYNVAQNIIIFIIRSCYNDFVIRKTFFDSQDY